MALEGALKALGASQPAARGGNPPSVRFTADEEAWNAADVRSPEARTALEKELSRKDLHPVARRVLQSEYAQNFSSTSAPAPAANDESALSGAIAALSGAEPKGTQGSAPAAHNEKPAPPRSPSEFFAAQQKEIRPLDVLKAAGSMAAAPGAAIAGGYEGLWSFARELVAGRSIDEAAQQAAKVVTARQEAIAFEPDTEGGKILARGLASPWNPLNWPAALAKVSGEINQDALNAAADKLQAGHPALADKIRAGGAAVGAVTEAAGVVAPMVALGKAGLERPVNLGAKQVAETPLSAVAAPAGPNLDIPTYIRQRQQAGGTPIASVARNEPAPAATPAAQAVPPAAATGRVGRGGPTEVVSTVPPAKIDLGLKLPEASSAAAAVESAPVKGGLPVSVQTERAAVLQRVGIKKAWKSAITGDVLEGATNAQTARFDQPAGMAAREQFLHETQALESAAADLATKAGGTVGTGEAAVYARGAKIAQPFDALRQWFDKTERALYKAADEKTGGMPVVSAGPVEALLKDRSFKNSVMAQDKGYLLTAVEDQLKLFQENNAAGLTVKNAEQFRQWLNQQWSHDNSAIIGRIKTAVDKAVSQAAGEDVYGSSRAMHILKKSTLEDPKGIAKLMDVDPKNPINRATAIEKIPQTIERLPVEQFKNIVDTLRGKMPPELRAQAQAAEAEIKAHFVNNLIEAATPNTKTPSPFWNNRRVNDFLAANEEKMTYLFSKEELARLVDIRAAGNIIAVDAAYPGAAAQAANAAKQGLLSRIISPAATGIGGGLGTFMGSIVGAPVTGGAAGATLGRAAGERMSAAAAEKSALKGLQKRMVPISELAP